MNKLVTEQTLVFLTSIQIGLLMGVLFDIIRIVRKLIKHPNFLVQIEDMFFWVFCAFVGFYILYICNYAEIRPFVFVGMILGATLYFLTLSIWVMKIATFLINWIRKVIRKVITIVLIPIRALWKCIKWPVRLLILKLRKIKWFFRLKYHIWKNSRNEKKMDKKVDHYLKKERLD